MGRLAALVPCFATTARGLSMRTLALVGRVTLCRRRAKAQPDKQGEDMDIQTKTDIIHQKIYDFLLYIYPLLTKYPKYEKFSLQTATRNAILEMLQEVIKWDKTATKSHLYTVDTALQESKELLRLAHDLKYSAMNARHYGESCRKLKEIGVMLGELIEEVKTRK